MSTARLGHDSSPSSQSTDQDACSPLTQELPPGSPFSSALEKFGYIPAPLDDEPLDGYLEHLAHGMRTDPMNLRRHFDLPVRLALGAVASLDADQVRRLTHALGLDEALIRAMTLQRFEHLGLVPQPQSHGLSAGAWPRGRGARYCPECLTERGHRWRLNWYVTWSFACTQHSRILLSDCPTCDQPVRSTPMGHPKGFHTGLRFNAQRECACPVEGLAESHQQVTPTTAPELLEPVLRAQRIIDGVLANRATTIDSLGAQRPAVEWLNDAATLVRLLAARIDPHRAGHELGQLLEDQPTLPAVTWPGPGVADSTKHKGAALRLGELWSDSVRLPDSDRPSVRLGATVRSPAITALCATTALHILGNTSVIQARESLGAFPLRGQASTGEFVSKYGTSWELATALRKDAVSARPGATMAVRLIASRFTATGRRRRPLSPSKVPATLWSGLLGASVQANQESYRGCAASTALLAIASGAGLHTALSALGHSPRLAEQLKGELAGILDLQTTSPRGTFAELLALHDYLSATIVPIDYARRRSTFQEPRRPSRRLARRVCKESGLRQTERLTAFMGWFVHELLTGHDILLTDPFLTLLAGHRRDYATLRAHWRAEPPPTLLRVAERALQVNRLHEPITWSPLRAEDGSYYAPVPDMTRQLNGWTSLPARGESRHLSTFDGRPLSEVVIIAEQATTYGERRLRIDLARFALVAENLEMSAASLRLGLAANTLSNSTRRLERRLGHQLFERTPGGLILTQPGRQLHHLISQSSIEPLIDGRSA